jgi:hypothetical protein
MNIDKFISWCCVLVLAALTGLFSFGVAAAVYEGRVQAFSKHGDGRIYLLAEDPTGFWIAICFDLLFVAMFLWFTYWTWLNRVHNERWP